MSNMPHQAIVLQEDSIVMSPREPHADLAKLIELRIVQSTHGRIRNLTVEEVQGRVVARGKAPSHHTRQLALQGALEILSGERFSSLITVG